MATTSIAAAPSGIQLLILLNKCLYHTAILIMSVILSLCFIGFILQTLLVSMVHSNSLLETALRSSSEFKYMQAAVDYLHNNVDCDDGQITSPMECRHVQTLPMSNFVPYLAEPISFARYTTKILERSRSFAAHDGVLVLDPYSQRHFGHLVLVFFIDSNSNEVKCNQKQGKLLWNGHCLSPAVIPRCHTSLTWRSTTGHPANRHCDHHFLPTVYYQSERPRGVALSQRLSCRPLPDFARCPESRPVARRPLCDPLQSPTMRCPSLTDVSSHCPLDVTCDQAVLITGGWNHDTDLVTAEHNLQKVYKKLRQVGFFPKSIQTFYADGKSEDLKSKISVNFHAAGGMKVAFRQHIQRICQTTYCMRNLVLYFNSPVFLDGSMLLWDSTSDFEIAPDEEYSGDELAADLSQCKAEHISVFLDTNFANRVAGQLMDLPNVSVYASTSSTAYANKTLMTDVFFSSTSHLNATSDLSSEFSRLGDGALPRIYNHKEGTNIFGSKIDAPVTAGCQSLPASVILHRMKQAKSKN